MTSKELTHFKKMVRVWKTKSLLFCLRYDPLIVFRRQNHITFIFMKTMSHDLLVQMAYLPVVAYTLENEGLFLCVQRSVFHQTGIVHNSSVFNTKAWKFPVILPIQPWSTDSLKTIFSSPNVQIWAFAFAFKFTVVQYGCLHSDVFYFL